MQATEIDGTQRMLITVSVMLTSVIQTLDNTIANVALPRIQGSLSATQDQMAWVLTSYIVAAAITIPLSGWLAGQFGRKRVFLISVAGFTVASMLCGMAQTLPQIIAARLLQGMCGAALVPLSQAVLLDINPPERHARATAVWVMGVTIGPIIGPALGGWLTENYNWRWVFYVNVPIGILAFLGILSFLPKATVHRSRFDFFGFASLSLAVASLQVMLDRGQLKDWFSSTEIWIETGIAAVAFYLFVVHMLTSRKPRFVSPALFKDRNFVIGNVFFFVVGAILFSTLALLPPLLQDLMNYPVVTAGLVTAPRGLGTLLSMFIVGRLHGRVDIRVIIGAGLAMSAVASWMMTGFDLQMNSTTLVWAGVLQGVGVGLVYVPLAAATFATLSPNLRNEGTSIFSLSRNLGSSIGISAVTTLLTRNTQIMHASLGGHVSRFNPLLRAQLAGGAPTPQTLAQWNATVTQQAAMIAYNNDFQLMMLLSVACIPLLFLLRKGVATMEPPHVE
jgi:MFS transporter, DHA2 family, multidrug resistance protein